MERVLRRTQRKRRGCTSSPQTKVSQRRSATRPERANDVKLGRGGIREIEFTVQLLQVVRGGQFPELRMRATLQALPALVQARLMPAETAQALHDAYVFLRQVEHRIQYLDDQQTHQIPTVDADVLWIAQTLGLPDMTALDAQLMRHRDHVAQEFERLLRNEDERPNTTPISTPTDLDMLLEGLSSALHERIARWAELPRVRALRDEGLQRLLKLVQRTQTWVNQDVISETAAVRWSDWMEPLLRRETYLALLLERPQVHAQLLRLLGAARWPARYLMKHPGVIDELADPSMLNERFDAALFKANLQSRYAALQSAQADDDESLLNVLRRAHHAELFLTLQAVSLVTWFEEDTPLQLISELRPDVLVKGGDYDMDTLAETQVVRAYGGRAQAIPFVDGYSTTALVKKIQQTTKS